MMKCGVFMKMSRNFQRTIRALLVILMCVMTIPLQPGLIGERPLYDNYVPDPFVEIPVQGAEKVADTSLTSVTQKTQVDDVSIPKQDDAENSQRIAVKIPSNQLQEFQAEWEIGDQLHSSNSLGVVVFETQDQAQAELLRTRLDAHPLVDYVEQDRTIRAAEITNDPYYTNQSHHELLDTASIWQMIGDNVQQVVAVLDTGVDGAHPDLSERVMPGYNFIDETALPEDDNGHGTHVAGLIAAVANNGQGVAGVCPNCRIMPLKVLDEDSSGSLFDLVDAIIYAVDNGANILNMSLTTDECSPMLQGALDYAWERGVIAVAAAGNGGGQAPVYPAACDHVLSVGALGEGLDKAAFSNFGNTLDVVAPGTDVWSALPGGVYGVMSGTSMATPVVAGVVAMTRMMRPELDNEGVVRVIQRTAEDLGEPGRDRQFGFGLVSVPHLLKSPDLRVTGEYGFTMNFAFHPLQQARKIEMHQSTDGGKSWQLSRLAAPLRADSMFATVFNLTPATNYLFRLHVIGGPYHGISSHVRHKTAIDSMPPSMPTDLRVIEQTKQSIMVSWTPSKDNKGMKRYEVMIGERIIGSTVKPYMRVSLQHVNRMASLRVVAIDRYENRSPISVPLKLDMLK